MSYPKTMRTKHEKKAKDVEKIGAEEVARLASLARLTLTSTDVERLRGELSSILEYFRVIDQVDEKERVDTQVLRPEDLRTDEVQPSDSEGVLRGVPRRKGRFVRAPRVS